jgi:hypothetical protein
MNSIIVGVVKRIAGLSQNPDFLNQQDKSILELNNNQT